MASMADFPLAAQFTDGEALNAAKRDARITAYENVLAAAIVAGPARIGARATTTAVQTIATGGTSLNNGGAAAWAATEDSGGFVSASTNTTNPLTIPVGLGGLYVIGCGYAQSAVATTLGNLALLVGGTLTPYLVEETFTGASVGNALTFAPLAAGAQIGVKATTNPSANASIGCYVFAYRIGN